MIRGIFGPPTCKVHHCPLEPDSVPVRYGLIRFAEEYRKAQRAAFPNARTFLLGGCRIGEPRNERVCFCPACRAAEVQWLHENPDFDRVANVSVTVQQARRELAESLAKAMLRQGELKPPERAGKFLWLVYRINIQEVVAYNTESRTYYYPFRGASSPEFPDVDSLVTALNQRYGQRESSFPPQGV